MMYIEAISENDVYKHIKLHDKYLTSKKETTDKLKKIFNSGNFIVDYYNLTKYIHNEKRAIACSYSSSIGHMFFDNELYFERRVNTKTLEFMNPLEEGDSFLIACLEEHKNFNDLKEYVSQFGK